MEHKEAVPMRRYAGSTGRCAQGELDIQFPLSQQYLAVRRKSWECGETQSAREMTSMEWHKILCEILEP